MTTMAWEGGDEDEEQSESRAKQENEEELGELERERRGRWWKESGKWEIKVE